MSKLEDSTNTQTANSDQGTPVWGSAALDQSLVRLLKRMVTETEGQLIPSFSMASASGYAYPIAQEILGTAAGAEAVYLEALAEANYLTRVFFDKVLQCPACHGSHLNLRDLCPQCNQADIAPVTLVHHFSCSNIAPEDEYLRGITYVCPKCHKELRHIGVDYDKPGQRYQCNSCHHLQAHAYTGGQCRSCHKTFRAEDCPRKNIYLYRLGPQAKEAIMSGRFRTLKPVETSDRDPQTGLFRPSFLRKRLKDEWERSRTYERPISVLHVEIDVHAKVFDTILGILRQGLTHMDIPVFLPEAGLVCLLLECNHEKVKNLATQIGNVVLASEGKAKKLIVEHATYSSDTAKNKDWEQLLTKLKL